MTHVICPNNNITHTPHHAAGTSRGQGCPSWTMSPATAKQKRKKRAGKSQYDFNMTSTCLKTEMSLTNMWYAKLQMPSGSAQGMRGVLKVEKTSLTWPVIKVFHYLCYKDNKWYLIYPLKLFFVNVVECCCITAENEHKADEWKTAADKIKLSLLVWDTGINVWTRNYLKAWKRNFRYNTSHKTKGFSN